MKFKLKTISEIDQSQWQALWGTDYPFVQYEFLRALETSSCTSRKSGWQPAHAVLEEEGEDKLLAAMPLYIKSHSYGEYVFDWAWANACEQAGLPYYPKMLTAMPFTPSTGPRIASTEDSFSTLLLEQVATGCRNSEISGHHILLPRSQTNDLWQNHGYFKRLGCQYHWLNSNFASFEDFLATFNSRKRKNTKRERIKVADEGIKVTRLLGEHASIEDWQQFYRLYTRTYLKRSGHTGYLNEAFFLLLGEKMKKSVALVKAERDGAWLAGALYFYDKNTLYGRYWGTVEDIDGLHFECCYYQGIELAIELGLARFDAGAQGEHKIQRGFVPVLTQSFHKLIHPQFHRAIEDHVALENKDTQAYCLDAREALPFKEGIELPSPDILTQTHAP